jgi:hypothetical protein
VPALPRPRNRRPAIGRPAATYAGDVFINCPFDEDYRPIRDALTFAVFACRLRPRCALEANNGAMTRIDKIVELIRDCRWGIHDISRTEPSAEHGLPRFNMPLELGLFLGAHRFGSGEQREKSCLVLDQDRFRYQKFISDIAGHDVIAHDGKPEQAIIAVRDWLSGEMGPMADDLEGGEEIAARFARFQLKLPALCATLRREPSKLTYHDYCAAVTDWLIKDRPGVVAC